MNYDRKVGDELLNLIRGVAERDAQGRIVEVVRRQLAPFRHFMSDLFLEVFAALLLAEVCGYRLFFLLLRLSWFSPLSKRDLPRFLEVERYRFDTERSERSASGGEADAASPFHTRDTRFPYTYALSEFLLREVLPLTLLLYGLAYAVGVYRFCDAVVEFVAFRGAGLADEFVRDLIQRIKFHIANPFHVILSFYP